MSDQPNSQELWATIVQAERELYSRRGEFHQHVSHDGTIAAALDGSQWDRVSALNFLAAFPAQVPSLLEKLVVDFAMSHRWAAQARTVISHAERETVLPSLRRIVKEQLSTAEADDYLRLAELLASLEAWDELQELILAARASNDVEKREIAEHYSSQYGAMWSR